MTTPNVDGPEAPRRATRRTRHRLRTTLLIGLGCVVVVLVVLRALVFQIFVMEGDSMEPSISTGQRMLVSRLSSGGDGDVVVVREGDSERLIVKRVVAVGGDTVEFDDACNLIVNGIARDEPFITAMRGGTCRPLEPVTVPDGHVYVLGDNRPASADSRSFGTFPNDDVVGRVIWHS